MNRDPADRRPNHLDGQTSPYLLQHLYNPVDWYPWGEEALERARSEGKPIFLSIGYAACHWCHVMERESFEDPAVAELLNRGFVSIKVDREERPDIDGVYMTAVQLQTGQGGWPLTAFLTPDLRPFFGGTYFPPEDRHGLPGFSSLLKQIQAAWNGRREEVSRSADALAERLQQIVRGGVDAGNRQPIGLAERSRAVAELTQRFDPDWGGFGAAPKFPPDGSLALLLREHDRSSEPVALQMVEKSLEAMATGGIYDQIGGGFARYSIDERWLIPHFEKMLYNQALLVPLYLDAWRLTQRPLYRRVVVETLDFVLREMTDPVGGFYSSLDADSEGEEGKFYVWTPAEIDAALGKTDGAFFREIFGVTAKGNFEGRNNPNLLGGSLATRATAANSSEEQLVSRLAPLRRKLLELRERRIRPGTDDKILTAWNGLMISAFARAYQLLGRPQDLEAARAAAEFLLASSMRDGRLLVSYRAGSARLNGYLDEYAFFGRALVDLYEADFEPRYLEAAAGLARTMIAHFEDPEHGGFYFTSDDHETLPVRNRSHQDGALPSGAGVGVELLLRLAVHLDHEPFRQVARRSLATYRSLVARMPSGYTSLLAAADLAEGPMLEVTLIGDHDDPLAARLLQTVRRRYLPRLALAMGSPGRSATTLPMLADKTAMDGKPTAYVCRDFACRNPTSDPEELDRLLNP